MKKWDKSVRGQHCIVETKLQEKVLIETTYIAENQVSNFPYGSFDILVYQLNPKTNQITNKAPLDSFYTNSEAVLKRQIDIYIDYWSNLNETIKHLSYRRREQERIERTKKWKR